MNVNNAIEAAVLRRLASDLEMKANHKEAWIQQRSGFYVQYEDQGRTMQEVRLLRAQAEDYRQQAARLPQ